MRTVSEDRCTYEFLPEGKQKVHRTLREITTSFYLFTPKRQWRTSLLLPKRIGRNSLSVKGFGLFQKVQMRCKVQMRGP